MPDTTAIQVPFLPATNSNENALSILPELCDGLFVGTDSIGPVLHKSLFTHHELQVQHNYEVDLHRQSTPGWFLLFILLSIILTVIYMRAKQLTPATIFQASVDHRSLERILREENLTHRTDLMPIALVMPIPLALVIYYSLMPSDITAWAALLEYLGLWAAIVAVYLLRNGVLRLMGDAFDNNEVVGMYISSNYMYHVAYAMAGSVMAFFVCYTGAASQGFLVALGIILGILLLCRLVRGLNLILTLSKSPKLYLFYYLCILEIVPILVILKLTIL